MSKKKHSVLGMAALAAAGAGAAVLANKSREEKQITEAHVDPNYRNTERGKNEKNSKGIYYTNGNYEAFATLCIAVIRVYVCFCDLFLLAALVCQNCCSCPCCGKCCHA